MYFGRNSYPNPRHKNFTDYVKTQKGARNDNARPPLKRGKLPIYYYWVAVATSALTSGLIITITAVGAGNFYSFYICPTCEFPINNYTRTA